MPPRARLQVLVTCCLALVTTYGCYQNLVPLYPTVARDLGVDAGRLGLAVAVGSVVAALVNVPAGALGDRLGRRPVLAVGMGALLVSLAVRGNARSLEVFALGQLIAGFCIGVAALTATAAAADAYRGPGQSRAIGIVNASINGGQMTGYLLAGSAGLLLGWRGLNFAMGVLPLATLAALWAMPEPPLASSGRHPLHDMAASFTFVGRRGRAALTLLAPLTLAVGHGTVFLLPFVLVRHGLGAGTASLLLLAYIAGGVLGGPLAGQFAERLGSGRLSIAALLLGVATVAAYPFLPWSIPLSIAVYVLVGGTVNAVLVLLSTELVNDARAQGTGTAAALSLMRAGQALGPALGPSLAGVVYVRGGTTPAFLAMVACMSAALLLFGAYAWARKNPPLADQSPLPAARKGG